jgi:hypothetical protein
MKMNDETVFLSIFNMYRNYYQRKQEISHDFDLNNKQEQNNCQINCSHIPGFDQIKETRRPPENCVTNFNDDSSVKTSSDDASTRNKRTVFKWELIEVFDSNSNNDKTRLYDLINKDWYVKKRVMTKNGQKVFFKCKHSSSCLASIYVLIHNNKQSVLLFKNHADHHHVEEDDHESSKKLKTNNNNNNISMVDMNGHVAKKKRNWGLSKKAKLVIQHLYTIGVSKPTEILYSCQKQLPAGVIINVKQISNYIHHNIKNVHKKQIKSHDAEKTYF